MHRFPSGYWRYIRWFVLVRIMLDDNYNDNNYVHNHFHSHLASSSTRPDTCPDLSVADLCSNQPSPNVSSSNKPCPSHRCTDDKSSHCHFASTTHAIDACTDITGASYPCSHDSRSHDSRTDD
mmetsp:Transcript_146810/g.208078  ORF Transcript_146810/g.208078 Transcript_146810/m.208078 type:complete len:123 (-) Transcript_146810:523-891(-)